MITVKEFEDTYVDGSDVNLPSSACVWYGEDVSGKCVIETHVYKVEDQFFDITVYRSNSGYWSDSEVSSVDVTEVRPYIFAETRYK